MFNINVIINASGKILLFGSYFRCKGAFKNKYVINRVVTSKRLLKGVNVNDFNRSDWLLVPG